MPPEFEAVLAGLNEATAVLTEMGGSAVQPILFEWQVVGDGDGFVAERLGNRAGVWRGEFRWVASLNEQLSVHHLSMLAGLQ